MEDLTTYKIDNGSWATSLESNSLIGHSNGFRPSFHNPSTGLTAWKSYGKWHRESGCSHIFPSSEEVNEFYLHDESLSGRLLLW